MDGGLWHCTGDRDQDHPQEKEMQKSKMALWGGLTNSCEKKGSIREKERYIHFNVQFQRIARRDKKFQECEFKWALESITMNKASGCDGIPVELFQIPKRWCCESAALHMPANLENSAVATGLEKVSFHSNPKERQSQRMLKLPHHCTHLTC